MNRFVLNKDQPVFAIFFKKIWKTRKRALEKMSYLILLLALKKGIEKNELSFFVIGFGTFACNYFLKDLQLLKTFDIFAMDVFQEFEYSFFFTRIQKLVLIASQLLNIFKFLDMQNSQKLISAPFKYL